VQIGKEPEVQSVTDNMVSFLSYVSINSIAATYLTRLLKRCFINFFFGRNTFTDTNVMAICTEMDHLTVQSLPCVRKSMATRTADTLQ